MTFDQWYECQPKLVTVNGRTIPDDLQPAVKYVMHQAWLGALQDMVSNSQPIGRLYRRSLADGVPSVNTIEWMTAVNNLSLPGEFYVYAQRMPSIEAIAAVERSRSQHELKPDDTVETATPEALDAALMDVSELLLNTGQRAWSRVVDKAIEVLRARETAV